MVDRRKAGGYDRGHLSLKGGELARAKGIAYRFLALGSRSSKEVSDRLRAKGIGQATIDEVMRLLRDYRYVDDAAFAQGWGKARLERQGIGRRLLTSLLLGKGLEPGLVAETVARLYAEVDEEELARRVAVRRMQGYEGLERQVVERRLAGLLTRRGFSWEMIQRVVQGLCRQR